MWHAYTEFLQINFDIYILVEHSRFTSYDNKIFAINSYIEEVRDSQDYSKIWLSTSNVRRESLRTKVFRFFISMNNLYL
jgi:hypothetical protein